MDTSYVRFGSLNTI
jgi:hypothetical protein